MAISFSGGGGSIVYSGGGGFGSGGIGPSFNDRMDAAASLNLGNAAYVSPPGQNASFNSPVGLDFNASPSLSLDQTPSFGGAFGLDYSLQRNALGGFSGYQYPGFRGGADLAPTATPETAAGQLTQGVKVETGAVNFLQDQSVSQRLAAVTAPPPSGGPVALGNNTVTNVTQQVAQNQGNLTIKGDPQNTTGYAGRGDTSPLQFSGPPVEYKEDRGFIGAATEGLTGYAQTGDVSPLPFSGDPVEYQPEKGIFQTVVGGLAGLVFGPEAKGGTVGRSTAAPSTPESSSVIAPLREYSRAVVAFRGAAESLGRPGTGDSYDGYNNVRAELIGSTWVSKLGSDSGLSETDRLKVLFPNATFSPTFASQNQDAIRTLISAADTLNSSTAAERPQVKTLTDFRRAFVSLESSVKAISNAIQRTESFKQAGLPFKTEIFSGTDVSVRDLPADAAKNIKSLYDESASSSSYSPEAASTNPELALYKQKQLVGADGKITVASEDPRYSEQFGDLDGAKSVRTLTAQQQRREEELTALYEPEYGEAAAKKIAQRFAYDEFKDAFDTARKADDLIQEVKVSSEVSTQQIKLDSSARRALSVLGGYETALAALDNSSEDSRIEMYQDELLGDARLRISAKTAELNTLLDEVYTDDGRTILNTTLSPADLSDREGRLRQLAQDITTDLTAVQVSHPDFLRRQKVAVSAVLTATAADRLEQRLGRSGLFRVNAQGEIVDSSGSPVSSDSNWSAAQMRAFTDFESANLAVQALKEFKDQVSRGDIDVMSFPTAESLTLHLNSLTQEANFLIADYDASARGARLANRADQKLKGWTGVRGADELTDKMELYAGGLTGAGREMFDAAMAQPRADALQKLTELDQQEEVLSLALREATTQDEIDAVAQDLISLEAQRNSVFQDLSNQAAIVKKTEKRNVWGGWLGTEDVNNEFEGNWAAIMSGLAAFTGLLGTFWWGPKQEKDREKRAQDWWIKQQQLQQQQWMERYRGSGGGGGGGGDEGGGGGTPTGNPNIELAQA